MTQNIQSGTIMLPKRKTHWFGKKVLGEICANSDEAMCINNTERIKTQISSNSFHPSQQPNSTRMMGNFRSKRTSSVISFKQVPKNTSVPAKASQIYDIIRRKNIALKLKHHVNDGSEPLPDILEIRQSVKKAELSFMRRMDKELNTTGNAFLLTRMKQELHIQPHNYLKQTSEKTRKHRKYLKDASKDQKTDTFLIFQCQLSKDSPLSA